MNRSSFFGIALCAVILGAPLGWLAKDFVPTDRPAVVVPEDVEPAAREVVVGELITLEVEGEDASWKFSPACQDTAFVGDGDNRLYVSFRRSGPHAVFVATSTKGDAAITRFDFNVTGSDNPGPGPGPDPNTTPLVDPFTTRVKSWQPGPGPTRVATALNKVAAEVEDRLNDSVLMTPEKILELTTREVNSAVGKDRAKWRPFFAGLEGFLSSADADGSLVTQRDYIRLWRSIAIALRAI